LDDESAGRPNRCRGGGLRTHGVLILSGGRPGRVRTIQTLDKHGYSGAWWVVCDDEDPTLEQYQEAYPGKVIVFSKREAREITDEMDNFGPGRVVVYARNAAWRIAESLGLSHFVVLDDDYLQFRFRWLGPSGIRSAVNSQLDTTFGICFDFLDESGAAAVAMAQGGDFIGGADNFARKVRRDLPCRKAMNVFFCRTDRPFRFSGRLNEDVTAYVGLGAVGKLFLTIFPLQVEQYVTQSNPGGLTEAYLGSGTYVKSFYSVIASPSSVFVSATGANHMRIHHRVLWSNAVPRVISERHRKATGKGV